LLFKLSCGAQGFFPAKRAFCPFCHIYAHFFQKLIFYRLPRPKLTILCRISRGFQCCICMSTYRVAHRYIFPPNVYFSTFFKKKILRSEFQAHFCSNVYQLSKIFWCKKFGNAIQTPLLPFHPVPPRRRFSCFWQKKMQKRANASFVGDLFPHRGKCCGCVQEFGYLRTKSTL